MAEMAFYTTVNSDSKDSLAITYIYYILKYIKTEIFPKIVFMVVCTFTYIIYTTMKTVLNLL